MDLVLRSDSYTPPSLPEIPPHNPLDQACLTPSLPSPSSGSLLLFSTSETRNGRAVNQRPYRSPSLRSWPFFPTGSSCHTDWKFSSPGTWRKVRLLASHLRKPRTELSRPETGLPLLISGPPLWPWQVIPSFGCMSAPGILPPRMWSSYRAVSHERMLLLKWPERFLAHWSQWKSSPGIVHSDLLHPPVTSGGERRGKSKG